LAFLLIFIKSNFSMIVEGIDDDILDD